MKTLLRGRGCRAPGDEVVATVDAFGRENGRQVLAAPATVDALISHARSFRALDVDLRSRVRKIEDTGAGGGTGSGSAPSLGEVARGVALERLRVGGSGGGPPKCGSKFGPSGARNFDTGLGRLEAPEEGSA